MKKLGKKFSFLTKIMLVVGLLISNLSSLSLVFAYEATDMVQITVVDGKLNIKYLDELAEEVENVNVNVYENYTYLDDTLYYVDEYAIEAGKVSNYSLTSEELLDSEGYNVESILTNIIFDGLYEVKVEITDTNNEVIDSAIYSENVTHDSGLVLKVFDGADVEIVPSSTGVYSVTEANSKVKVVAKVLAGGLNPTDEFYYEDEGFMASDLLDLEFKSEMDYNGYLFGEYTLPVAVKVLDSNMEEVVYDSSLNIMYEEYAKNDLVLNNKTSELLLEDSYKFVGESKDGSLNVLLDSTKANTMLDLYNIVNSVYGDSEIVSYAISNSEYEDVLATYDAELLGVTLEEYLETMLLDDTTVLTLSNDGLTITYNVLVVGDTNGDNVINQDDLLNLVDQVLGEEVDLEKSDLNKDGSVDVLDVMYLDQVSKNESWDVTLEEVEATVDANLVLNGTDIVSGDEFTVDYVLSVSDYAVNGVAGLFKYDETMLELVSIEVANEWLGNYKDGKFLYLGTDSLTGTVTTDEETGEEIITPEDYVIVTATFKALMSGESEVSVEEREYINQNQYLNVTNELEPVMVLVNASNNNNLASLTVAGQVIELLEDVLEYEITVGNDVTVADVEAILENVAASITSIVAPEELAEGENTITITVTAENGDEKVYTVVVNRDEAVKEETTTQVNYNNYYNDYEEDKTEELPTIGTEEETEEEEEIVEEEKDSNLSRIVIIILILLVIAGLIYLIFKDEDDEETKKTNKDINRLKKEKEELDVKEERTSNKSSGKSVNNNKNKKPNNKK